MNPSPIFKDLKRVVKGDMNSPKSLGILSKICEIGGGVGCSFSFGVARLEDLV